MKKSKVKRIVVKPDSHAKPGVANTRFELAGKFLLDYKPDILVDLGDHWDMEALSTFDVGKKSFEGRTYKADVESGREAMELLLSPLRRAKRLPALHFIMGNHEWRIHRAIEVDRKLEGTISFADLGLPELGFQVHNFKEVATIEGVGFIHYVPNGLMDRPIGGLNVGKAILRKAMGNSLFQGHRHDLDVATDVSSTGKRVWGGTLGCFLEEDQWETYVSKTTQLTWWRGLTTMEVIDGNIEKIEFISLKSLKEEYGK
jgi:hypothetical protein